MFQEAVWIQIKNRQQPDFSFFSWVIGVCILF